jgi:hypothetical protein
LSVPARLSFLSEPSFFRKYFVDVRPDVFFRACSIEIDPEGVDTPSNAEEVLEIRDIHQTGSSPKSRGETVLRQFADDVKLDWMGVDDDSDPIAVRKGAKGRRYENRVLVLEKF